LAVPEEKLNAENLRLYLVHLMDQWKAGGRTGEALAEALGVSGSSLSQLRSGRIKEPTLDTLLGFARVFGTDLNGIVEGAEKLARGEPTESRVEYDERYPNRAAAIEMARAGGLAEEAIADIASMANKLDHDPPALEWFDQIRALHNRMRLGLGSGGVPFSKEEREALKPPPPPKKKPTKP
jgi:transcriptional regulator with XRE-family HTH domain